MTASPSRVLCVRSAALEDLDVIATIALREQLSHPSCEHMLPTKSFILETTRQLLNDGENAGCLLVQDETNGSLVGVIGMTLYSDIAAGVQIATSVIAVNVDNRDDVALTLLREASHWGEVRGARVLQASAYTPSGCEFLESNGFSARETIFQRRLQ
jgi:hypothetical protein